LVLGDEGFKKGKDPFKGFYNFFSIVLMDKDCLSGKVLDIYDGKPDEDLRGQKKVDYYVRGNMDIKKELVDKFNSIDSELFKNNFRNCDDEEYNSKHCKIWDERNLKIKEVMDVLDKESSSEIISELEKKCDAIRDEYNNKLNDLWDEYCAARDRDGPVQFGE
jgi:hypothetical protein